MAKRKMPKRPKRPKLSSSANTWMRFEQRMKDWQKKCSDIKNAEKKKQAIIKKYSHF